MSWGGEGVEEERKRGRDVGMWWGEREEEEKRSRGGGGDEYMRRVKRR